MSKIITQLAEQNADALQEMKALVNTAEAENRVLTGDETARYKELKNSIEVNRSNIQMHKETEELQRSEAADVFEQNTTGVKTKVSNAMKVFSNFITTGKITDSLKQGTDTEGGYLVPDEIHKDVIIKAADDRVSVRKHATIHKLKGAKSIGMPTLETDLADTEWTTEVGTTAQDATLRVGKRKLEVNPLSKLVLVSRTLIRNSAAAVKLVFERLAAKFAMALESAYMIGDGAGKPLGVFVASALGISTARDVVAANATSLTGDDFIDVFYNLHSHYQQNAVWYLHPDVFKEVVKLKDSQGNYIYQPSLRDGLPATILGRPVELSPYAPSAITANSYVAVVGDFSNYHVVDGEEFNVQVLIENFAQSNQNGYLGRGEADGAPVLEDAFSRLKMAAA